MWNVGGFGKLGGTVVCNGDVGFKLGVLGSKCLLGDPVWDIGDPEDPTMGSQCLLGDPGDPTVG